MRAGDGPWPRQYIYNISTIYLQYVSDVGVAVCDLSSVGAGRAGGQ